MNEKLLVTFLNKTMSSGRGQKLCRSLCSLLLRLPAIAQIAKIAADNNLLLQRNSSPRAMDELVGRTTTGKSPSKVCPLLGSHFLTAPKKCYLSRWGSISLDKTVYLSADVGGRPLFTLRLGVPIKDRHYNPIRSLVAPRTLDPSTSTCPDDDNDVDDDRLAVGKMTLSSSSSGKESRKHYRLQVLPWGQEGAISGALGGTTTPLLVNTSKQLLSPISTWVCQHNSSGFQFPLPSIPRHLYSRFPREGLIFFSGQT